jgi:exonuclease VII small subunit
MNNNVMNNLENSKNTLDSAITELQRIQKLYSKLDEIADRYTSQAERLEAASKSFKASANRMRG